MGFRLTQTALPDSGSGWGRISCEKLLEAGGEAKILCAGCLTDIAVLLERHPDQNQ